MSVSAADIETIVRLVVARLQALDAAPGGRLSPGAASSTTHVSLPPALPSSKPVTSTDTDRATLVLTAPLVSLEHLRGKAMNGVQVVEVPRRAVVTPAVKDELKLRGIQLRRARAVYPPRQEAEIMLIAPASKGLRHARLMTEHVESTVAEGVRWTLEHLVAPTRRVVWCSRTPFAALHGLNAHETARTALLFSTADLLRAETEMQPNVLLLDDRRWSLADINNLVHHWQIAI
jgi:hypothetical protein